MQQARLIAFDTYQRIAPKVYDRALPVRIVDIDEASLAARGQWQWPRTDLAQLVDRLEKLGAVAIPFDTVFPEPDRLSPPELAKRLIGEPDYAGVVEALARHPSNDAVFAEAIGRSGVVMGFAAISEVNPRGLPPLAAEIVHKGDDPRLFVPAFGSAVVNLPVLTAKVHGSGFINRIAEHDQVIRKLPLLIRVGDRVYPSIATEALRLAQGATKRCAEGRNFRSSLRRRRQCLRPIGRAFFRSFGGFGRVAGPNGCGKGVPASLLMSFAVTVIRAVAAHESYVSATIVRANAMMHAQNAASMFATVFYGVLDLESGRLEYSNCGHNPPFVLRRGGERLTLAGGGTPLGLFGERRTTTYAIDLAPGVEQFDDITCLAAVMADSHS